MEKEMEENLNIDENSRSMLDEIQTMMFNPEGQHGVTLGNEPKIVHQSKIDNGIVHDAVIPIHSEKQMGQNNQCDDVGQNHIEYGIPSYSELQKKESEHNDESKNMDQKELDSDETDDELPNTQLYVPETLNKTQIECVTIDDKTSVVTGKVQNDDNLKTMDQREIDYENNDKVPVTHLNISKIACKNNSSIKIVANETVISTHSELPNSDSNIVNQNQFDDEIGDGDILISDNSRSDKENEHENSSKFMDEDQLNFETAAEEVIAKHSELQNDKNKYDSDIVNENHCKSAVYETFIPVVPHYNEIMDQRELDFGSGGDNNDEKSLSASNSNNNNKISVYSIANNEESSDDNENEIINRTPSKNIVTNRKRKNYRISSDDADADYVYDDDDETIHKKEFNQVRKKKLNKTPIKNKAKNKDIKNDKKFNNVSSKNQIVRTSTRKCVINRKRKRINSEDEVENQGINDKKNKRKKKGNKLVSQTINNKINKNIAKNNVISLSSSKRNNANKNRKFKVIVINDYDYEIENIVFSQLSDDENNIDESTEMYKEVLNLNWREITETDSPPIRFSFTLQSHTVLPWKKVKNPVDYFKLLYTDDIIDMLIDETNYNALRKISKVKSQKSPLQDWINVHHASFCTFIAMLINMGLNPRKDIENYWNYKKSQFMPYFPFTMSKTSFLNIFSNFQLRHSNSDEPTLPSFHIRKLLHKLTRNFQKYLIPCRYIKIDEVTVSFKGKTYFKINHTTKSKDWGMKMFLLTDSKTGFIYGLEPYFEKEQYLEKYQHLPVSTQIALSLIDRLLKSFPSSGYHFYTDKYFTCLQLAKELYKRKCHLTGIISTKKKDIPIGLLKSDELTKGMIQAVRKNEMMVLHWFQDKSIYLLSNYHTAHSLIVSSKLPELKHIVRPVVVADYVKNVKSTVNLEDQFMISSAIVRKTIRWYKRYFFWLLDLCLVNSYILYKLHCKELKEKIKYSHNDFRVEIIEALTTSQVKYKELTGVQTPPANIPVNQILHALEKTNGPKFCIVCTSKNKKCYTYCKTCGLDKFMHMGECFEKYHVQNKPN